MLVNLRTDPFENAEVAGNVYYNKWRIDHVFAFAPAGALVAQFMASMKEFPQRQSPDSFSPEKVLEEMRRQQAALETGSGTGVK
jgi:arylsulfatase